MFNIFLYKQEKLDGFTLESISKNSLSYLTEVKVCEPFQLSVNAKKAVEAFKNSENNSLDLHYIQSILVSSVWNDNDDIFLPEAIWSARYTANDKPFNIDHDSKNIIGHTTASLAIDDAGNILNDDLAIDELPSLFHIASQAVIYKVWGEGGNIDEDKVKQISDIIDDIKDGKYYVSVEALFPNFDYALKDANGNMKLVARNEKTSFLTKYLRIYGGKGVYEDYKIGRVPRNIIFSGKGLVKVPANKASIIFAKKLDLNKNIPELVYEFSVNQKSIEVNTMDETKLVELQNKISDKDKLIETLQASLKEVNDKQYKTQIDKLSADLVEANKSVNSLNEKIVQLTASLNDKSKLFDEASEQLKKVSAEAVEYKTQLDKSAESKRYADRVTLVASKLNLDNVKAEAFVKAAIDIKTEDAFTQLVDLHAGLNVKSSATETATAAAKALEKIETPTKETTLSTDIDNSGVNKIREGMASLLKTYVPTVAKSKFKN